MKTVIKIVGAVVLVAGVLLGTSFMLSYFLLYSVSQPYCPDRVIEVISPEVSC